jgi:DUF4097 and DUF4098 domain-containing protein YvlB
MKKIQPIYLFVLMFFCWTIIKPANDEEQSKTKTFAVSKGGKLIVDVNPGDIKIQTWDKDEVEIKVTGLNEDEILGLEMKLEKNVVTVQCSQGDESEFNISVPRKFHLELKTTAGDIKFKGDLDGNADLHTNGGDIRSQNVKGSLTAETMGGDIKLGDVDGYLNINTMGGDISVGEVKGKKVKINTNGGEIRIKNSYSGIFAKTYGGDISMGNAGGDSEFLTYGGNIDVGEVTGSVNMETYGGDLLLKSANGKVKAKTNGGNINLDNVTGSIDAKTLGGDINVELTPSAVSESWISTGSGKVELSIPSSAKATIEARIHVQGWFKNAGDNYKINSDFESRSYTTDSNTHEIVGIYELNGGGSKIFLKTVNDEINIKKASK